MSAGLFDKKEMLNMLKHLGDEFAGAKITQNKKKEIEVCQEAIALLTNFIGDAEIRAIIKYWMVTWIWIFTIGDSDEKDINDSNGNRTYGKCWLC